MGNKLDLDIKIAKQDFKAYIIAFQIRGRALTFRLRFYIDDWLAQPVRIKQFKLNTRPLDEVNAIAEAIEKDFRDRWVAEAAKTRRRKANPKPANDPRNLRLL